MIIHLDLGVIPWKRFLKRTLTFLSTVLFFEAGLRTYCNFHPGSEWQQFFGVGFIWFGVHWNRYLTATLTRSPEDTASPSTDDAARIANRKNHDH